MVSKQPRMNAQRHDSGRHYLRFLFFRYHSNYAPRPPPPQARRPEGAGKTPIPCGQTAYLVRAAGRQSCAPAGECFLLVAPDSAMRRHEFPTLAAQFFREDYCETTESTEDTEKNQPHLCELCVLRG